MQRIRVGVAGLGFGAAVHVPGLQSLPGVEVVAVAGRRLEAAKAVAARAKVSTAVASWERLLDLDLDAVSLALPPLENERACRAALGRGIPVLSEKPLAGSAAAARELRDLAAVTHAVVDFEFAELDAFRCLEQMLAAKQFGEPRHLQITWLVQSYAQRTREWSWKTDRAQAGGVTSLLGSHLFYLLERYFGGILKLRSRASCLATSRFAPRGSDPAEDLVDLWVDWPSGMTASVTYSNSAQFGPGHRWDCVCESGTITLHNPTSDYMAGFQLSTTSAAGLTVHYQDAGAPAPDSRIAPFRAVAGRFVDAVRGGGVADPGFGAGARVQELMEAVWRGDNA